MATATERGAKTEAGKAAAKERVNNQGEKPSRKILTPAEKVAKLEAELAEARKAAEAKERAKLDKLRERRSSLATRIQPLIREYNEIGQQLDLSPVEIAPVNTDVTPTKGRPLGSDDKG